MQQLELRDHLLRRYSRYTGPGSFDELTGQQLMAVLRIRTEAGDSLQQALQLVRLLFGVPGRLLRRLSDLQLMQLAVVVEFAFEPEVKMQKWLFSVPKASGMMGPADTLDHLCFAQLMHADQLLDQYRRTQETRTLYKLVAALYIPNGAPFDATQLEHRSLQSRKQFSLAQAEAIRFNYVACRATLATYFPYLFPVKDAEDEVPDMEAQASNDNWLDVAIQLARKEHALGRLRQLEQENVYLVLRVLDRVIKEYQELEAEYAKMKS